MSNIFTPMTRTKALIAAGVVAAGITVGGGAAAVNVGLISAPTEPTPEFQVPAEALVEPTSTTADPSTTTIDPGVEVIYQDVYDTVPPPAAPQASATSQSSPASVGNGASPSPATGGASGPPSTPRPEALEHHDVRRP